MLSNKDKVNTHKAYAISYLISVLFFLSCFGAFEGITKYNPYDAKIKIKLQLLIFVFFIIYSIISNRVQKSLKLETKIFWDNL